jgi:hypothetical protein
MMYNEPGCDMPRVVERSVVHEVVRWMAGGSEEARNEYSGTLPTISYKTGLLGQGPLSM